MFFASFSFIMLFFAAFLQAILAGSCFHLFILWQAMACREMAWDDRMGRLFMGSCLISHGKLAGFFKKVYSQVLGCRIFFVFLLGHFKCYYTELMATNFMLIVNRGRAML